MKVKVDLELTKEGRAWDARIDGEKVVGAVGPIGFVLAGVKVELLEVVKAAEALEKEQKQLKVEQGGR